MKIVIESIPHSEQRYETPGDYYNLPDGSMVIRVSKEMGKQSCLLVAIHELVEQFLCSQAGITNEAIDDFDREYEANRKTGDIDSEPGDSPDAPYERQHNIATGIERLVCAEIGMPWEDHTLNVIRLFRPKVTPETQS